MLRGSPRVRNRELAAYQRMTCHAVEADAISHTLIAAGRLGYPLDCGCQRAIAQPDLAALAMASKLDDPDGDDFSGPRLSLRQVEGRAHVVERYRHRAHLVRLERCFIFEKRNGARTLRLPSHFIRPSALFVYRR